MHSVSSVASATSEKTISSVWPSVGGRAARTNENNSSKEKMSPAKRIRSEVRAANADANAASNIFRKTPDREGERPDSKLTPSIVEPDSVGDSGIYLTEDVDGDLGAR
ncbi:hypothetical protein CVT25_002102 [Psilocybe cyanescens]|uniref:Uncharacterized protein n=1 Tax=Psilocybe cyanescens TaxID=93625 RepID=A0A409X9F2_PSICY|nr:hypothetical protein CVT25_002102 [Psilocybe cyanescens]